MSLILKRTLPEDARTIIDVAQSAFGSIEGKPQYTPSGMQWKYWDPYPGWEGSRGFLLLKGDQAVAHGSAFPFQCIHKGRELRITQVLDWGSRKGVVGAGAVLMKRVGSGVDAVLAIGGSGDTLKMTGPLAFRNYGQVTAFVRPLRSLPLLWSVSGTLLRRSARTARSVMWRVRSRPVNTSGWKARRMPPSDLTFLPVESGDPGSDAPRLIRTREQLEFLLRCPFTPISLYGVEKGGVLRGYFLLAEAPAQVRIASCWLDPGSTPEDWAVLYELASGAARLVKKALEVVTVTNSGLRKEALTAAGFHMRHENPLNLMFTDPALAFDKPFVVEMIENDAAWLHNGKPSLYA